MEFSETPGIHDRFIVSMICVFPSSKQANTAFIRQRTPLLDGLYHCNEETMSFFYTLRSCHYSLTENRGWTFIRYAWKIKLF